MSFTSYLLGARARTRGLACCTLALGCASPALAKADPPVTSIADAFLMRDGWTYTPILQSQPNAAPPRCVALFAARNEGEVSATAINAVLYSRGTDCDWTAVAWESADPAEAVKYTKVMLGVGDEEDGKWGEVTTEKLAAANFPDPPAGYDKGMFVSDPLYGVVRDDIDRDAIIEALEDWGFKVAKISIESKTPDECFFRTELCRIATMAEACGPLGPEGMVLAAINEVFEMEECAPPVDTRPRRIPRYTCDEWVFGEMSRGPKTCQPSTPACPGASPFTTCPITGSCSSRSQSGQPGAPKVWDCDYSRCYTEPVRRTTMWSCTDRVTGAVTTGIYYDYRVRMMCQRGRALGAAVAMTFPLCEAALPTEHRWHFEGESIPRNPWQTTPPSGHPDGSGPLPPRSLPPPQEWEWMN